MVGLIHWIEERIMIQRYSDGIKNKLIPSHSYLFYCINGILFVFFLLQICTGFCNSISCIPEIIKNQKNNTKLLQKQIILMRSIHKWGNNFIILGMIFHSFRILLTGGLNKPRKINWIIGILLSSNILFYNCSKIILCWDKIGITFTKIFSSFPEILNIIFLILKIGLFFVSIIRGGIL